MLPASYGLDFHSSTNDDRNKKATAQNRCSRVQQHQKKNFSETFTADSTNEGTPAALERAQGSRSRKCAHLDPSPRFPALPWRRMCPPQRRCDRPHRRAFPPWRGGAPRPPERRGGRRRRGRRSGDGTTACGGSGEGGTLDAQPPAGTGARRLARGGLARGPHWRPCRRRAARACHGWLPSSIGSLRGPRRRPGEWHLRG
jgi:hypothetical protein